jgi:SAM-dependent methyltransferase
METESALEPSIVDLPFEFESLAQAIHYQRWVYETVEPLLGNRILEVGAGIGNMSKWLPVRERLILIESDPTLFQILKESFLEALSAKPAQIAIDLLNLEKDSASRYSVENLDTIISFNVLEHIEADIEAVRKLVQILRESDCPVRRLISFVPAQAWAYSVMDKNYGHFRRYSLSRIKALSREVAPEARLMYRSFNALGLLGWVWSAKVMASRQINPSFVRAYDRICRHTKRIDDLFCQKLRYPWGQSFIWVLEWSNLSPM